MKIVFTGGGTGGHFYPLMAVAESVNNIVFEKKMVRLKMYYIGPRRYDEKLLERHNISFIYSPAGKMRRQKSIQAFFLNMLDIPKTGFSILLLFVQLIRLYPDIIFSKGGYASFPVLVVARLLRTPLIIHDSDAVPGRATLWSAPYARYIAISYPEAMDFFREKDKEKIALTGNPIRKDLIYSPVKDPEDAFGIEKTDKKTIIVLGGSSGAEFVNRNILDAIDQLVKTYRVIHLTGQKHIEYVKKMKNVIFQGKPEKKDYIPIASLDAFYLRALYSVAGAAISRAGSSTLVELATWGIPTIVIPIPEDVSRDQTKNAYAFSRATGSLVIEQQNLLPNLLKNRLEILFNKSEKEIEQRKKDMFVFAHPHAAENIATTIIEILLEHQA